MLNVMTGGVSYRERAEECKHCTNLSQCLCGLHQSKQFPQHSNTYAATTDHKTTRSRQIQSQHRITLAQCFFIYFTIVHNNALSRTTPSTINNTPPLPLKTISYTTTSIASFTLGDLHYYPGSLVPVLCSPSYYGVFPTF